MKKPLILFVYIDSCVGDGTPGSGVKPTGTVNECLEGVTSKLFVAKTGVTFASVADFKLEATWKTKFLSKDVTPLYFTYEVLDANTEAVKYESGNFSHTTEKAIKKMTAESYLSYASHAALKSYQKSEYTQVFEVTEANEIIGVGMSDGKVKGQDITDFDVAVRFRATKTKPGYSMQTVTFRDPDELEDNPVVAKPSWDVNAKTGIFGLTFEIVGTPTASEIKLKALKSNGVSVYNALVLADFKLETAAGVPVVIDSVSVLDDVYTLVGTATFTTGDLLSTAGVVDHDPILAEALPVAITF